MGFKSILISILSFLFIVMVVFITIFVNIIGEDTPLTMYEVFSNPNFGSLMNLVFMIAPVVSVICICRDFDDKTVNYEIMGGIKRRDVFLSRYLTAMILGGITTVAAIFVPMALGSIIWGFGNTSQAGYLLFRYLLFIIATIRELSFVITLLQPVPEGTPILALIQGSSKCVSWLNH